MHAYIYGLPKGSFPQLEQNPYQHLTSILMCDKGDLSIVSTLISADADINAKNEYGITPLWELFNNVVFDDSAAHITAIIDYLDQNGITIKLADIVHAESGVSLLQLAVRAGHESAVERIMKVVSEQELNRDGKDCRAAILECTKLPSAEVMRVILQQVLARGLKLNTSLSRLAMLNHSPGLIIATPLLWAIRMYDYETVELLLKCGADPNYTGSDPSARPDYPIVLALSSTTQ
jgi:ankyrin repeat protein